jgi:archaellum biogenesis protein FlaJ (TadC family)
MKWSAKDILRLAVVFLLLATVVVVAILRLGGLITWPDRTVALIALALMLVPIGLLLVGVVMDSEEKSDSGWSWLAWIFPPWR